MGLCNLTEVVVRAGDTLEDIWEKIRIATILGTFQSTLTNFRYVRSGWRRNAEEERLLGVSLTGIMDSRALAGYMDSDAGVAAKFCGDEDKLLSTVLEEFKQYAIETNQEWSERLGIEPSAAITTVKPSGTVSQLVDSASGIHPRYSEYYVRTVRADVKDPLSTFLVEQGVPWEWDVSKTDSDGNVLPIIRVFSFPMKAPDNAVFRNDLSAIDQLEHYLVFAEHWCEHNPSITVYVRKHEWMDVGAWVYKNFKKIGGVSFLPHSDHSYPQAPYQEITKEKYDELAAVFPKINWEAFHEQEDGTTNAKELACVAGVCEL